MGGCKPVVVAYLLQEFPKLHHLIIAFFLHVASTQYMHLNYVFNILIFLYRGYLYTWVMLCNWNPGPDSFVSSDSSPGHTLCSLCSHRVSRIKTELCP